MAFAKFCGAAFAVALVAIWVEWNPVDVLVDLAQGVQLATNLLYKAFVWACMFAAVMVVTPAPRNWENALVCALLLTVALMQAYLVAMMGIPYFTVPLAHVISITALVLFALVLWPIWRWYSGLKRTS